MTTPYIYWLEHKPTGKGYIGSRTAKGCHPDELLKTYFTSSKFVRPIAMSNPEDFEITYIRKLDSKEKALEVETGLLNWVDAVHRPEDYFNKHNGSRNFVCMGHTPETCAKMSALQTGKKHSPETLAKMSEVQKGHIVTDEARAKLSAAQTGKKHSPETLAKMSEIKKGKKQTPEARAQISEWHKGRVISPEARAKISASKRKMSREQADNIRLLRYYGYTQQELGELCNVTVSTISEILNNKTWK